MTPDTPLQTLPGVGEARAKALRRLGLETAGDLLHYYPRAYEDRTQYYLLTQAPVDTPCCIRAVVAETPRISYVRPGLSIIKCKIMDESGQAELVFFNQDYVCQSLCRGEHFIFYGRVDVQGAHRKIINPAFEPEKKPRFTGRIMPIYPLTAGVSNNLLAGLALRCVESCAEQAADKLPATLRMRYHLSSVEFALQNIHFPRDSDALALARRRLAFEELFILSCGMAFLRQRRGDATGRRFPQREQEEYCKLLPFPPTGAQRRAMDALSVDLTSGRAMNRLVQGDVGSGKTVVAAFAVWLAYGGGVQSAFMAPTEILARQHYETLTRLLHPAGLRVGLLVGSLKASEKKAVRAALAAGELDLAVGTHALLSACVEFRDLGLVITDEQHRFGVAQRSALSAKAGTLPHVLVMSATPIPRTLALLIYGDLDVTVLDELPPGRTPVATYLVDENKRQRMYGFVRKQVSAGRQVYIVCPAVEEGEGANLKAVTVYARELQEKVFPELRVGFVYGRQKAREKDAAMTAFAGGEMDILVSTTVVEVGVDIPNANLMIIENADHFGLSQLHQLRGRVGRGKWQSYCVLVSGNYTPEARERMRYFCSTADGFQIAEKDLEVRGPGDFFGSRQHGLPALKAADFAGDTRLLSEAQQAAREMLAADPALTEPEHAPIMEKVRKFFHDDGDIFN